MKNTPTLTIHLTQQKKQKVGTLATKDKKIYFEYDKAFLKNRHRTLPLQTPPKSRTTQM